MSRSTGIVQSYNDWANLVYNGGLIGQISLAELEQMEDVLPQETDRNERTEEMHLEMQKSIERSIPE